MSEKINQRNQELVKEFFRLVNYLGNDGDMAEALADHLRTEHRTLQQNFWRTIQMTSLLYAEQTKGHTDLRNEGALAFTEAVNKVETYLPTV